MHITPGALCWKYGKKYLMKKDTCHQHESVQGLWHIKSWPINCQVRCIWILNTLWDIWGSFNEKKTRGKIEQSFYWVGAIGELKATGVLRD